MKLETPQEMYDQVVRKMKEIDTQIAALHAKRDVYDEMRTWLYYYKDINRELEDQNNG